MEVFKTASFAKEETIQPKLSYKPLQEKDEHLGLLEGMLIDLLKTKWNTFVKFRFYRQFILFSCYFVISLVCFTLRPGPPDRALNTTAFNATVGPVNDTDLVMDVGKSLSPS